MHSYGIHFLLLLSNFSLHVIIKLQSWRFCIGPSDIASLSSDARLWISSLMFGSISFKNLLKWTYSDFSNILHEFARLECSGHKSWLQMNYLTYTNELVTLFLPILNIAQVIPSIWNFPSLHKNLLGELWHSKTVASISRKS